MNNIVIYSSKPMPDIEAVLMEIDECEVRMVEIGKMKDYAILNPSLMIKSIGESGIIDIKSSLSLSLRYLPIRCS